MINTEVIIRKDQSVRRGKLAGFRRQAKAIENFFYRLRRVDCAQNPHRATASIAFQNVKTKNMFVVHPYCDLPLKWESRNISNCMAV